MSLYTLHIGLRYISGQRNDFWQHSDGDWVFPPNQQVSHRGWRASGLGQVSSWLLRAWLFPGQTVIDPQVDRVTITLGLQWFRRPRPTKVGTKCGHSLRPWFLWRGQAASCHRGASSGYQAGWVPCLVVHLTGGGRAVRRCCGNWDQGACVLLPSHEAWSERESSILWKEHLQEHAILLGC